MKRPSDKTLLTIAAGVAALVLALAPPLALRISRLWFLTLPVAALLFLAAAVRRKWLVMLAAVLGLAGICVMAAFFPMHLTTRQRERLAAAGQLLKGDVYFSMNRFDSALVAYTNPGLSNLRNPWRDYQIARTYAMLGKTEEAFYMFARLAKSPLAKETGQPDLDYAYAASRLGSYESAIKAFEEAVRENRAIGYSYFQMAQIYQESGKLGKAEEMLSKAHRLKYEASKCSMMLGRIAEAQGDREGAEKLYRRALRENLENLPVYGYLANLLFTLNRHEESREILNHGLRIMRWVGRYANPADAAVFLNGVGYVYARAGNQGYAEMFFRQAVAMNFGYTEAYLNLARLYAGQGRLEQARQVLSTALSVDPQSGQARQMLEKLNSAPSDTLRMR